MEPKLDWGFILLLMKAPTQGPEGPTQLLFSSETSSLFPFPFSKYSWSQFLCYFCRELARSNFKLGLFKSCCDETDTDLWTQGPGFPSERQHNRVFGSLDLTSCHMSCFSQDILVYGCSPRLILISTLFYS